MKNPSMSKAFVAQLKRQAMKRSRVAASEKSSANEIAAGFSLAKDPFLASVAWKSMRNRVIQTYGVKCMKCGYAPQDMSQINVDHIKPRKYYPALALEFENLQVLCCACNKQKGNKDETDYRPREVLDN